MDVPGIIFTCLAICLVLLCLVCGFFACLYYSSQNKTKDIRPPASALTDHKNQVNKTSVKSDDDGRIGGREETLGRVEGGRDKRELVAAQTQTSRIPGSNAIPNSSSRRPSKLSIQTQQMAAQSAVAIETDHSVDHFLREMAEKSDNRDRLLRDEFEVLSRTEARRTSRSGEKATRHNSANRYANILPYDHTLVELRQDHYINASYVQGENDALRFIATQAPIGAEEDQGIDTVPDFWRMIVEKKVECIVMLTDIFEGFVQKSGHYWPMKVGNSEEYGDVRVKLVSETQKGQQIHREFDVHSLNNYQQKVSHYQFKNWKDHDAPDIPSFLDFILKIRKHYYHSPIVVHCSAGIGRTGVYICTDNIISRIENEAIIDVFSEVNRARQQRPSMVHSFVQYEAIYNTIALYLRSYKL